MSSAAKGLAMEALVVTAIVVALQVALSCTQWRWPVAGIGLGYSTLVLLRIGPLARDERVSFEEKRFVEFVGACALLGAGSLLLGPIC